MILNISTFATTGFFPYAIIVHPDDRVWNTTLNGGLGAFETFVGGNWAQYAVALIELPGTGYYSAPYPAAIVDILTTEVVYFNGTPTLGDEPAGIAQSQGVNIASVFADATVVQRFQTSLATMVRGTVIAGTLTATAFSTDVVNANLNAFQGRSVLFATGNLAGQGGVVSGFDPGTGVITIAGAFTGAPSVNDIFVIS